MFYIIEGIENENVVLSENEAKAAHEAHVAYVNMEIEKGRVKLAGPKAFGKGGFIILKAESADEANAFVEADPSFINGIQRYNITPWKIFDIAPGLESINE